MRDRPRKSLLGLWDRLIGPGATLAEQTLTLTWMLVCSATAVGYALIVDLGWSPLQLAIVAAVALDIGGGVSDTASNSAKRWWHRPGRGPRQHLSFVFAHVHPFVLALAFPAFGWATATGIYAYLLVAATVVVFCPLYLKRPLAFVLYSGALLGSLYGLDVPRGLEWFAPLYFLKLLLAYLLPETAYLPSQKGDGGDHARTP